MSRFVQCLLAAVALSATTPSSHAAKPAPVVRPIHPSSVQARGLPRALQATTCTLGEGGPALFSVNYLLPPNDAYYTLFHCDACPETTAFAEVRVALAFPTPCDQEVQVSVVGAVGDAACLEPDPLTVLHPAEPFTLSPDGAGNFEFSLVLSQPARIGPYAFLCVNFVSLAPECSSLVARPQLLTSGSCTRCKTWNYSVAGEQDLCAVVFPGQPVMYALGSSCAVPVASRTWGALKLHYR